MSRMCVLISSPQTTFVDVLLIFSRSVESCTLNWNSTYNMADSEVSVGLSFWLTGSGSCRIVRRLKSSASATFAAQSALRGSLPSRWWAAERSCSSTLRQQRRRDFALPKRARFRCNLTSRSSSTPTRPTATGRHSRTWCWSDPKRCRWSWCSSCTAHRTARQMAMSSWNIRSSTSLGNRQLTIRSN